MRRVVQIPKVNRLSVTKAVAGKGNMTDKVQSVVGSIDNKLIYQ